MDLSSGPEEGEVVGEADAMDSQYNEKPALEAEAKSSEPARIAQVKRCPDKKGGKEQLETT